MAEAQPSIFSQILVFLAAAVVAVPLFRWLRLGRSWVTSPPGS